MRWVRPSPSSGRPLHPQGIPRQQGQRENPGESLGVPLTGDPEPCSDESLPLLRSTGHGHQSVPCFTTSAHLRKRTSFESMGEKPSGSWEVSHREPGEVLEIRLTKLSETGWGRRLRPGSHRRPERRASPKPGAFPSTRRSDRDPGTQGESLVPGAIPRSRGRGGTLTRTRVRISLRISLRIFRTLIATGNPHLSARGIPTYHPGESPPMASENLIGGESPPNRPQAVFPSALVCAAIGAVTHTRHVAARLDHRAVVRPGGVGPLAWAGRSLSRIVGESGNPGGGAETQPCR